MSLCLVCDRPTADPSVSAGDPAVQVHPACLAERLPYDAAAALTAAVALFLVPFLRVWSA